MVAINRMNRAIHRIVQASLVAVGLSAVCLVLGGCPVEQTPTRDTAPQTEPTPDHQQRQTPRSDPYDDL